MINNNGNRRINKSSYSVFVALLMILFVLRGLILLCVYPPLEGIDEHKHLGYLAFVSDTKSIPVYGQSVVPAFLYKDLRNNPHSHYGASELTSIGALDYAHFWSASHLKEPLAATNRLPVKAAFHPPGYYFLIAPLFQWSSIQLGFRATIYLLRIINLLFASCALGFFLMALRPFCDGSTIGYLIALAVSLLPMFLVYICRVSNDALSMVIIGFVFYLLSRSQQQKYFLPFSLLLGACMGLGIWIRVSIIPFIPVALVFFVWLLISRQIHWRYVLVGIYGFLSITVVISYGIFAWNSGHYHTLFPSQEIFRMGSHSLGPWNGSLIGRLIGELLIQKILVANLWTSGWSFLHLPAPLYVIYGLFLAFFGFCLVEFIFRSRKQASAVEWNLPLLCLLTFAFVCFGALMHALQSVRANAGIISTPSYYALPGYLPFLGMALFSMNRKNLLIQYTLIMALIALFLAAEWSGTFLIGVPFWTQTTSLPEAFGRLQSIHPAFPAPKWIPLFVVLYGGVGWAIGRLIFKEKVKTLQSRSI